jgi:hypothetical protein
MGERFRPWETFPLVRAVSTRPASDPLSKSQARRTHVTGSTKIGPISISSTGRVNVNLFGFTIPLRRVSRL